jgi:hypothetical protein
MAKGHENLIPFSERNKEEARELGTKGGKKSGETRRRKRDMKTAMNYLLSLPAGERNERYAALGGEENPTNLDEMLAALLSIAMTGDVAAVKQVREIVRDDERLKYEREKLKIEQEKLKMLKDKDGGEELDKLDGILDKLTGDGA